MAFLYRELLFFCLFFLQSVQCYMQVLTFNDLQVITSKNRWLNLMRAIFANMVLYRYNKVKPPSALLFLIWGC